MPDCDKCYGEKTEDCPEDCLTSHISNIPSYSTLYSIYNNLRSTQNQIKKLYEGWDFGRQKQDTEMASHWVGRASVKIYDLLMDEYPEFEDDFQGLETTARKNDE